NTHYCLNNPSRLESRFSSETRFTDLMTVSGPNAAVAGPSGVQSSPEPKPSPAPGKKEPPVYAPGSPEEQWQLQIEAKGRVTCPRCKSVCRKTVEGLKKHMDNCKAEPYSCPHCGKQLKTNTGMKYHIMADHSLLPSSDANDSDHRATKEELRKILKRLGRLKCSREGCTAGFTSVMGYFYHMRTCGKAQDELQKLVLSCSHCGKNYKSKAGLEYHTRNEHAPVSAAPESAEQQTQPLDDLSPEPSSCGRAKRASAQAASLQLAQIAQIELPKDWGKRKFTSDLVPEDHKVRESNPQPRSQDVLKKWRSEVKVYRKVQCPNQGCGCTYTSVSGLKAHLGLCNKGDFAAGKYRCLICNKEFNSESGVKYHINSIHEQVTQTRFSKGLFPIQKILYPDDRKHKAPNIHPYPSIFFSLSGAGSRRQRLSRDAQTSRPTHSSSSCSFS
uniref:Zinc finger protein 512 n=1 Tax=Neogobius melanostomus TaxID=47308 RepID=A0A8C6WRA5_9GOBI